MTHILILVGHPDPDPARLARALARAYADGASAAGHDVETIDLAQLDIPLLRRRSDFETGPPPPAVVPVQAAITRAEHLVVIFPLWLGGAPAALHAVFEQVFRPGFAFAAGDRTAGAKAALGGRSSRLVVTMGMPALVYRWWFGAHGVKALEYNLLRFCGIRPVRTTLLGMVEGKPARRKRWLERMAALGRRAR